MRETDPKEPWTSENLLALGKGFMESRIYLTAVELGLFPFLVGKPLTSKGVATQLHTDLRATNWSAR